MLDLPVQVNQILGPAHGHVVHLQEYVAPLESELADRAAGPYGRDFEAVRLTILEIRLDADMGHEKVQVAQVLAQRVAAYQKLVVSQGFGYGIVGIG